MDTFDIRALNEQIEQQSAFVTNLQTGMAQTIIGQKHLVESLLIGLLSDGHVLLEGVLPRHRQSRPSPRSLMHSSAVYSSHRTFCQPMLSVQ